MPIVLLEQKSEDGDKIRNKRNPREDFYKGPRTIHGARERLFYSKKGFSVRMIMRIGSGGKEKADGESDNAKICANGLNRFSAIVNASSVSGSACAEAPRANGTCPSPWAQIANWSL